jgi:S1-C subfamily serine protease
MEALQRLVITAFIVGVVITSVRHFFFATDVSQPRRPAIERPDAARPVPAPTPGVSRRPSIAPPSASDPLFEIPLEQRRASSVGTAFLTAPSTWMSARHVADLTCTALGLRMSERWQRAEFVGAHPQADVVVMRLSSSGIAPLPLSDDALVAGQDGFAVGYPGGVATTVHGQLLGRTRMQVKGRFNGTAATTTWADLRRDPPGDESLGGLSGGPLFNRNGEIIGVMVAATPRRGRFHAVAPEILAEMSAWPARPAAPDITFTAANWAESGAALRARRRVVQAGCQVGR